MTNLDSTQHSQKKKVDRDLGKLIPSVPDCLSASIVFHVNCRHSKDLHHFPSVLHIPGSASSTVCFDSYPSRVLPDQCPWPRVTDEVPGRLARWPGRALEMNRSFSVVFQIASKYCILDSLVDYDGYSISSEGIPARSSRYNGHLH